MNAVFRSGTAPAPCQGDGFFQNLAYPCLICSRRALQNLATIDYEYVKQLTKLARACRYHAHVWILHHRFRNKYGSNTARPSKSTLKMWILHFGRIHHLDREQVLGW